MRELERVEERVGERREESWREQMRELEREVKRGCGIQTITKYEIYSMTVGRQTDEREGELKTKERQNDNKKG